MKNTLSFILCLFLVFTVWAQKKKPVFPNDFLGVYKGTLVMNLPNDKVQEIPMEFHLLATDTSGRFTYTLVYDGKPRNYTLVEKDASKGSYEIDENNGIILGCKFIHQTLYSYFQVGDNFLNSRLAFSKRKSILKFFSQIWKEKCEQVKIQHMKFTVIQ